MVSLMLAFKYLVEPEDLIPNSTFANLLNISPKNLLRMELGFLELIDHAPFVQKRDFDSYLK